MRVLMFGWEFPPYISGGLGTACKGIVDGLVGSGVDVTLVLPSANGMIEEGNPRIIAADRIPLQALDRFNGPSPNPGTMNCVGELASLNPYATSENRIRPAEDFSRRTGLVAGSVLEFEGNYGRNLIRDVLNYGLVGNALGLTEAFDVIHAHDWITFPAGVSAKKASGRPLVVHVHATEYDRNGDNANQAVVGIEAYGLQNADRVIAVSGYTKRMLVEKYRLPPGKITVVHNAVSERENMMRPAVHRRLKGKSVLFLGRVTMQKGPDYYLETARLVLQKTRDVRFIMAGSGDLMTRLIGRMAYYGLPGKFHFTGFLRGDDVRRIFEQSDLLVMPSVSEPFGLVSMEAVLHRIPVIVSKQSGVAEILTEAPAVDFWDVQRTASLIVKMLSDEVFARGILARCQAQVAEGGWARAGTAIREEYTRLVS